MVTARTTWMRSAISEAGKSVGTRRPEPLDPLRPVAGGFRARRFRPTLAGEGALAEGRGRGLMSTLRSLCVFCGYARGADPRYAAVATGLGRILARSGIELIYGGGHHGMMGALAEAALTSGGRVTGVIPDFLMRMEAAYLEISEMVVVTSMEARKRLMLERSDAFCVLPGGFGTMDEAFEVLTQKQLGLLEKPVVFVNVNGYFSPWCEMIKRIVEGGFAPPEAAELFTLVDSEEGVLPAIEAELALPVKPGLRRCAS